MKAAIYSLLALIASFHSNGSAIAAEDAPQARFPEAKNAESPLGLGMSAFDVMESEAFAKGGGKGTCKACNRIILSALDSAMDAPSSEVLVIHSQVGA